MDIRLPPGLRPAQLINKVQVYTFQVEVLFEVQVYHHLPSSFSSKTVTFTCCLLLFQSWSWCKFFFSFCGLLPSLLSWRIPHQSLPSWAPHYGYYVTVPPGLAPHTWSKFKKFIRSKLNFFRSSSLYVPNWLFFLVELTSFICQPPRLYLMCFWIFMFFDLYVSPLAPPDCVDDPPHHPSSYYYYLPAISKMKIPNKKVIL